MQLLLYYFFLYIWLWDKSSHSVLCLHNTHLSRSGPSLGFLCSAEKPANRPCILQVAIKLAFLQEPRLDLWLSEGTTRCFAPTPFFAPCQFWNNATVLPRGLCSHFYQLHQAGKQVYACCLYKQLHGGAHCVPSIYRVRHQQKHLCLVQEVDHLHCSDSQQ